MNDRQLIEFNRSRICEYHKRAVQIGLCLMLWGTLAAIIGSNYVLR